YPLFLCHRITGGELFERIIDESFDLNESRCVRFMNEILQGVEYIHNQGVLHLDLKPENILCLSRTSFKIKIIDFGLARFYDGKEICVLFGTPEFVSPEVISYEPVCPAADMWSVGVICYVMLSGLSPFMGDSQSETLANILRVTYDFNYPEFAEISEDARNFIRRLLVKDPRKRMTATECLQHPWIKKKQQQLKRKGTVSKKRLKHFVYRRKWQKAVNAIIALQRMGVVLHHPIPDNPHIAQSNPLAPVNEFSHQAEKQPDQSSSTQNNSPVTESPKSRNRRKSLMSLNRSLFSRLTTKRVPHSDSLASEDGSPSPQSSNTPNSSRRSSILSKFGWNPSTSNSSSAMKTTPKLTSNSISPKSGQAHTENKRLNKKDSVPSKPDSPTNTANFTNKKKLSIRRQPKSKPDVHDKTTVSPVSTQLTGQKSATVSPVTAKTVDPRTKVVEREAKNQDPVKSVDVDEKNNSQRNEHPPPVAEPTRNLSRDSTSSNSATKIELKLTVLKPPPRKPTPKTVLPQGTSIADRIGFFSNLAGKSNRKP
ncbi:Myosin light chain kinase smooth muscle, partial [Fasciola gigantica]